MEGRIGIGAPLEGVPFVHVARLVAAGRCLVDPLASTEFACAGDGRGDIGCCVLCCGTAGALSRATSERRSQEEVFEVSLGEASGESFAESSDFLLPNNLDDEDFRRRGSNASWKYSWSSACLEVGLDLGSQRRHHVTNWARLAGHCGVCRMVSSE
jgi:hypothetical protein